MPEELLYLYFGQQCPWTDHFAKQAEQAADLLQLPYRAVDISSQPDLAERHNVFYPGAVVIGDFQLVYPGQPEQMVDSFRRRGPLPGQVSYQAKPPGLVDRVERLTADNCGYAFRCCLPSANACDEQHKSAWLCATGRDRGFSGLVGWQEGHMVGFVETLPETSVPYPLGEKRADHAFITCLYSPIDWGLQEDYRVSLLQHLFVQAKADGYRAISVISGVETPSPNGPIAIFEQLGFIKTRQMGRALLRCKWEDAWLLHKRLD